MITPKPDITTQDSTYLSFVMVVTNINSGCGGNSIGGGGGGHYSGDCGGGVGG